MQKFIPRQHNTSMHKALAARYETYFSLASITSIICFQDDHTLIALDGTTILASLDVVFSQVLIMVVLEGYILGMGQPTTIQL